MWWREVAALQSLKLLPMTGREWSQVEIHPTAIIDEALGPVRIGPGTKVCAGAYVAGPASIGANCLVGNHTMLRGPFLIGDRVRIGFATEIKQALVDDDVAIGPQCFVADSKVERGAYLGAQVRTSNQRLDRQPVKVMVQGQPADSGLEKLGCRIGQRAALGIQCIILPGREIAAEALFEPRITISRNFPTGHYRVQTPVESVPRQIGV